MHEFELIDRYFDHQQPQRSDVKVGIGDDAAIVQCPPDQMLAITTDTLVANVHFQEDAAPFDIGHKALAVNLSDLAAVGATPAWVTLALTLPEANEQWIKAFCKGFFTLANRYQVQLIGGDLTQGPLSITIQATGFVPPKQALLRSQAKANDLIYVTGALGDAGLALQCMKQAVMLTPEDQQIIMERLHRPEPRIAIGHQLLGRAQAAIDISDGLAVDLSHILAASHVGATLYVDKLPLSSILAQNCSPDQAIQLALTAGDDYELCFTAPANQQADIEKTLPNITCIGVITAQPGLDLRYQDGKKYHGSIHGYQHF